MTANKGKFNKNRKLSKNRLNPDSKRYTDS